MVKVLTIVNSSAKSIKTQIVILIRTAMTKFSIVLDKVFYKDLFFSKCKVFIKISLFPNVTIIRVHMITKQWVNYNLIICCRVGLLTVNNNAFDNKRERIFVYIHIHLCYVILTQLFW